MPLMVIFEPLFLLLALAAGLTLLAAAGFALAGRFARAGRLLRRLGIGAALYFAIVIVVSAASPRQVYAVGERQCFDDWCITVERVERRAAPVSQYIVALRLANRAKRLPMGEKGTVVYLTDAMGRRFDPEADTREPPFDTLLQPGASIVTSRRFQVPTDAKDVGLVYTHEGGFPIGWLIIGEGGWFQQPPMVRF